MHIAASTVPGNGLSAGERAMKSLKRVVVAVVAAVACAGVYGALRNLPVISGCGFYANCPSAEKAENAPTSALAAAPAGAAAEALAP
jgi:hypothetical protein